MLQNNNIIKRTLAYSAKKIKANPPTTTFNIKTRNKLRLTFSKIKSSADKSLARPGRIQATASEDFDVHISYLLS
jgi:hypothetical protein